MRSDRSTRRRQQPVDQLEADQRQHEYHDEEHQGPVSERLTAPSFHSLQHGVGREIECDGNEGEKHYLHDRLPGIAGGFIGSLVCSATRKAASIPAGRRS